MKFINLEHLINGLTDSRDDFTTLRNDTYDTDEKMYYLGCADAVDAILYILEYYSESEIIELHLTESGEVLH